MKKIFAFILTLCMIFSLVACGGAPVESEVETTTTETMTLSDENLISMVENLVTVFDDLGTTEVTLDNNILYIKITQTEVAELLSEAMFNKDLSEWDALFEGARAASESIYNLITEAGNEYDVTVTICDFLDGEDTVFIGTLNNEIVFDITEIMGLR